MVKQNFNSQNDPTIIPDSHIVCTNCIRKSIYYSPGFFYLPPPYPGPLWSYIPNKYRSLGPYKGIEMYKNNMYTWLYTIYIQVKILLMFL